MCGVTGWVNWSENLCAHKPDLARMTTSMWRRGPDASGIWVDRHVGLGHRRLAVIDVEGGVQPMSLDDEAGEPRVVITYSGEVYNFGELRQDLERRGHRFTTRSDTEVVLRAYDEWGIEFAERLNGMYAFAIWDVRREELVLVRDRLGVKPLYYADLGGALLFGSEPKAILANPAFRPVLDAQGVAEMFAVPAAPTPGLVPFRGMAELIPGTVLRYGRGGARTHRYWELPAVPHEDDLATTVETVEGLLGDAVSRQLVSDVPLGMLLSGGLDSSTLVALAARGAAAPDKHATYSVTFPPGEEPQELGSWNVTNDAPFARKTASTLGTTHTEVEVSGRDILAQRGIGLTARDLPGWGEPDTSLYLLFRGIREHSTVALSGEVADEVFGGYGYFFEHHAGPPQFPWLAHAGSEGTPAALLRPEVARASGVEGYAIERAREALAETPKVDEEPDEDRRFRERSYLALTRWLPALLARKDRMSMAVGLEVRVPFADHRLVEYVWNTPRELRAADGVAKGLLRRVARGLLPEPIVSRAKSGYPATSAPGYGTALRERVGQLVAEDAPVFSLVDRRVVRDALESHATLPGPRAAPHPTGGLEYLVSVDEWLRTHRVELA